MLINLGISCLHKISGRIADTDGNEIYISECTGDNMQCSHIGNGLDQCLLGYGCAQCNSDMDCTSAASSHCETTTALVTHTTGTCTGNICCYIYNSSMFVTKRQ